MTASTLTSAFPGLLSDNIGLYRTRPENFLASFLVHAMAVVLRLAAGITDRPNDNSRKVSHAINVGPISFLPDNPGGHGGGRTRDQLPASRGALPKLTLQDQLRPKQCPRTLIRSCPSRPA